jgi:hypothetical protein
MRMTEFNSDRTEEFWNEDGALIEETHNVQDGRPIWISLRLMDSGLDVRDDLSGKHPGL